MSQASCSSMMLQYRKYDPHMLNCIQLCELMDTSLPCSSVHGIFQARILEWVAYSRASFRPRGRTHVSCIGRRILYHWATWEAWVSLSKENRVNTDMHAQRGCIVGRLELTCHKLRSARSQGGVRGSIALLVPWSQTYSFQNHEARYFYYLSDCILDTLLQQP